MKVYLVLFLLLNSGLWAAPMHPKIQNVVKNLFKPIEDRINTQISLYKENYVFRETEGRLSFLGERDKACGSGGASSRFDETIIEGAKLGSNKKSSFNLVACQGGFGRSLYFQVESDKDLDKKALDAVRMISQINLREGESYRKIQIGSLEDPEGFYIQWRRSNEKEIQIEIGLRGRFFTRFIHKAYSNGRQVLLSQIRPIGADFDGGRYSFRFDSNFDLQIEKAAAGGIRYFKNGISMSRLEYDQQYKETTVVRIQYTILNWLKDIFNNFPKAEVVDSSSGQTQFVIDLERAFQFLRAGDSARAQNLLQNNLKKIRDKKVIIREVD